MGKKRRQPCRFCGLEVLFDDEKQTILHRFPVCPGHQAVIDEVSRRFGPHTRQVVALDAQGNEVEIEGKA